jgi:hypothetical protein
MSGPAAPDVDTAVRKLGAGLLGLVFADSVLGIVAAGQGVSGVFAAHVGLGVGLILLSGATLLLAFRRPGWRIRLSASLTFGAIVAAAVSATSFLLAGSASGQNVERALGLVALLGAALLVIWGKVRIASQPPRAPG